MNKMGTILGFLVLSVWISAASTLVGGSLSLNKVDYLPSPAQPGEYLDVFLGVSNEASTSTSGVQCQLKAAFPFSLDTNEDAVREVGILAPRQGVQFKYKVRVDPEAVPGDNELRFACKTESNDWVTAKLNVFVQAKDAVLVIQNVLVEPQTVTPGGRVSVSISVQNTAKIEMKDVSVALSLNASDVPFAPFESASQKRWNQLAPDEQATAEFQLVSSSDAPLKLYKIPLTLSYSDAQGKSYVKTDLVGIVLGGSPEISSNFEGLPLRPKTEQKVTIRLNNAGLSDAKFLRVNVGSVPGLTWVSNTDQYVGTISSDNYESVTLNGVFEKAGTYDVPLSITYKDVSNAAYRDNQTIRLLVYSPEQAQTLGLEKPADYTLWIVLLLIIGGYLAWRNFGKKAKAAKSNP